MGQVYSLFRAGTVTPGQDQDERPKTTAPVHHQNERPFDFIGLPGEIRLMVYRYCIPHKLNIQLERIPYTSQKFRCAFKEVDVVGIGRLDIHTNIATSLLLVSRACHQEAAQLLYAQNAFSFAEYACEQPRNWIRAIGPGNAAQIRQLEITSADLYPFTEAKADMNFILPQLAGVRQLNISAIGGTTGGWKVTDLRLIRLAMSLVPQLRYIYAQQIPRRVGWGRPYDYHVQLTKDPKNIGQYGYVVDIDGEWKAYWGRITGKKRASKAKKDGGAAGS